MDTRKHGLTYNDVYESAHIENRIEAVLFKINDGNVLMIKGYVIVSKSRSTKYNFINTDKTLLWAVPSKEGVVGGYKNYIWFKNNFNKSTNEEKYYNRLKSKAIKALIEYKKNQAEESKSKLIRLEEDINNLNKQLDELNNKTAK